MYHDFLIFGGAGLVGTQVVRHIVKSMSPRRIVVASLFENEAREACERHRREFGEKISFVPAWGNLFVPSDLAEASREDILEDVGSRRRLLDAVYGPFEPAFRENHLVEMVRQHRPEVIVDAVNTATGLSYQDVFDGVAKVRDWIGDDGYDAKGIRDLESLLLSQTAPQLIRHVRFVQEATTRYGTRVYLKVGTTGTGGMGLNIPYTHSEDRPSRKLLAKTEAAFGHTGLMFLLARTPHTPIVKEVKPAAMIGYRAVQLKKVTDKHRNSDLFDCRAVKLKPGGSLELREDAASYQKTGDLRVAVVDTGENGVFTRGEFSAITALGQMEYVTPEEIARVVVREIGGANTGQDIVSALDGSVLNPSYKAGLVRSVAMRDLEAVEDESIASGAGVPSIALGRLGPPELSKLLFEAALLRAVYDSMANLLADTRPAEQVSADLVAALEKTGVGRLGPSIGIPVLLADGSLIRGPRINVPEVLGHTTSATVTPKAIDTWARKGWIDLRPSNVERWRERVQEMTRARSDLREEGSAAATINSYMSDRFDLGETVAWIFNNEQDAYRIK
ncbi:MAG: hypothetical protein H6739_16560 [Alphaproteobacteria bacterium]|nr:hypothetical protein [Alphaproteobacteria bacterium]